MPIPIRSMGRAYFLRRSVQVSRWATTGVFFAIVALAVHGCDSDSNQETFGPDLVATGDQILPLALGNEWHYDDSDGDSFTTAVTDTVLVSLAGQEITGWVVPGRYSADLIYATRRGGLHIVGAIGGADTLSAQSGTLWLRHPVESGEEWDGILYNHNGRTFELTDTRVAAVSTNQTCVSPAGVFECTKYEYLFDHGDDVQLDARIALWMAPGIGLVRQQIYADGKNISYEASLREFSLVVRR